MLGDSLRLRAPRARRATPRPGAAILLVLGLAAAPLAPAQPAAAQGFDPAEPAFWAVSGVALFAAWQLDADLRRANPTQRDGLAGELADAAYFLGGRGFVVPVFASATALSHLTGWPTEGPRMVRVVVGGAMAGLAVEVVKHTVGRGRPRDVDDPYRFRPFERDNAWMSFPSGHAAAGFAMAGALDQEFDLKGFELVGYGVAGVIAWSRVYDDAHWASDVVAGGIMGVAVSRATIAWLQRRGDDDGLSLRLDLSAGPPMLTVSVPVR